MDHERFWIIGYGNEQRRDDGIGPYVIRRLEDLLKERKDVELLRSYQLDPSLACQMELARGIIFVDASVETMEEGWSWLEIEPSFALSSYTTHHGGPSFFSGLMLSLYGMQPRAWLMSIQGYDFGFGEGLTEEAEKKAREAVELIMAFLTSDEGRAGNPCKSMTRCKSWETM